MWRRNNPTPAEREPHPDPAVETKLQRIITLQRAVARKEALLDQDQRDIASLRSKVLRQPGSWHLRDWQAHIAALEEEMNGLEEEIRQLHDEIGERVAALDAMDVAYLFKERRP